MSFINSSYSIGGGNAVLTERRAYIRHACQLETACQPLTLGPRQQWQGRALNLSQGGLGLVLDRRFEKGTLLAIEIHRPDGAPGRSLLARVAHVSQQADGLWLIGCAFANKLTEEDVTALL